MANSVERSFNEQRSREISLFLRRKNKLYLFYYEDKRSNEYPWQVKQINLSDVFVMNLNAKTLSFIKDEKLVINNKISDEKFQVREFKMYASMLKKLFYFEKEHKLNILFVGILY